MKERLRTSSPSSPLTSFTLSHSEQSNFVYNVTFGPPFITYIGPVTLFRSLVSTSIYDESFDDDEAICRSPPMPRRRECRADRRPFVVSSGRGGGGRIIPVVVDAEKDDARWMPPSPILRDEDDAMTATRNGRGDLMLEWDECRSGAAGTKQLDLVIFYGSNTVIRFFFGTLFWRELGYSRRGR